MRVVTLMPTIAMTSTTTARAVSMAMFAQVLPELLPNAASTVGARISTPLIVPRM